MLVRRDPPTVLRPHSSASLVFTCPRSDTQTPHTHHITLTVIALGYILFDTPFCKIGFERRYGQGLMGGKVASFGFFHGRS